MKPLALVVNNNEQGEREELILPSRGIKLIGIRFYPCPTQNRSDIKNAKYIQKNLYGHDWLYFNKGFTITEDEENNEEIPEISHIDVSESAFDSSFLLYSDDLKATIGFSAIIGQNGTGKSTIVDTIIRLINNLSAAIIGEDYVYSSAQHLHYINNVYAALAVYINNEIKVLTCLGDKLIIRTFGTDIQELAQEYENAEPRRIITERYKLASSQNILYGNEPKDKLLPPQNGLKSVLQRWFYTLVVNYSLYAYNYRDYFSEVTGDAKLEILRKIRPEDNKPEDKFWLKGVFHKNDGYQTPVVIHPMRYDGYVDATKVNYLGKQNLISLAFAKSSKNDCFPFRTINNTHHLVGFYFYDPEIESYDSSRSAVDGIIREKLRPTPEEKERYREIEEPIIRFWANAIGINPPTSYRSIKEKRAWHYLVYKTIKIFQNYKHYTNAWNSIQSKDPNADLNAYLSQLLKDSSHRTLKLRQVLTFLKFYDEHYCNKGAVGDIDDISKWIEARSNLPLYQRKDLHMIDTDDLLPPPYPITNVVLQLVDNEHYDDYKDQKNQSLNIIPFEGLSSGERQIAYSLGNIIYHLKNIESSKQDYNSDSNHLESTTYEYVNVMLDEVELYFHPDLQRRFVSLLLDAMKSLDLKGVNGINVTLITHSPFVLSDIPVENILSLSRSKDEVMEGDTFAANIHDLFNNTFILPYTIGELARKEIEDIVAIYNDWRAYKHTKKVWHPLMNLNDRQKRKLRYIANIIGDEYINEEVNDMLDEMEEDLKNEKN